MTKADLLKMAFGQRQKKCILGGTCAFLLEYQHILFCASEVLGQGCQVEKQRLLIDQDAQSEGESSQETLKLHLGSWLPGFRYGSGFHREEDP